jgi:hypothetical protein
MKSPTSRSLDLLRAEGYRVGVVERYNSFTRQRVDLFGLFDLIAVGRGRVLFVQTTTASNMAARRTKMREADDGTVLTDVLADNSIVELHGWVKRGHRWHCKREIL